MLPGSVQRPGWDGWRRGFLSAVGVSAVNGHKGVTEAREQVSSLVRGSEPWIFKFLWTGPLRFRSVLSEVSAVVCLSLPIPVYGSDHNPTRWVADSVPCL